MIKSTDNGIRRLQFKKTKILDRLVIFVIRAISNYFWIVVDILSHDNEKIAESIQKTPSIILIGGNAQSGKSTLAAYLEWKLKHRNRKVLRIELDNWIIPENKRKEYDSARLKIPPLKYESGVFFNAQLLSNMHPKNNSRIKI